MGTRSWLHRSCPWKSPRKKLDHTRFLFALIAAQMCVLQKQIQSLNKMCSNLLEKISKEERESESGGTEGWAAKRRKERGRRSLGWEWSFWRWRSEDGRPNCLGEGRVHSVSRVYLGLVLEQVEEMGKMRGENSKIAVSLWRLFLRAPGECGCC